MRARVNALIAACAAIAVQAVAALATASDANEPGATDARDRWIPSASLTAGFSAQQISGSQSSTLFDEGAMPGTPLRETVRGDDRVVNAYAGGTLDLMTPELPFPGGPRFFVSGEFLPTFGPNRKAAQEGQPARIRGPDVGAVLAVEETSSRFLDDSAGNPGEGRPQARAFGENDANGQGMETTVRYEEFVFGAKAGVAFPFEFLGRRFWLRPSVGWIRYEVEVEGIMVDPSCNPTFRCTNTYATATGDLNGEGFLRESILKAKSSEVFDGFGPGIDLEMLIGRFGPVGTSLYIGGQAYYVPGDREIVARGAESYDDQLGQDVHEVEFRSRVAPWYVRGGLGIRFQWLGSPR